MYFIPNESYAQFFPYNPYGYNPGYALGQQLGTAIAQKNKYGRNQLRKAINKWGECSNGSLSLEHGAVAIYGSNGYFCSSAVDNRISSKLKSINKDGGTINDINILENGNFIIVYNQGKQWYGVIPSSLNSALDDYPYGTVFKSISFNESGTYAITTSKGFKSNSEEYQAFYDDNIGEYGNLLSVNICGNGAVFCYSDGVRYCGYIPNKVERAFRNFSQTAQYVIFNKHGDYLICTAAGSYSYSIADANSGSNASTAYFDYYKERKKKIKEKAFARWENKAYHVYRDSTHLHKVFCTPQLIDMKLLTIEVMCKEDPNIAPTVFFDLTTFLNKDEKLYEYVENFKEKHENVKLQISLKNGETLTTQKCGIYPNVLNGIDVGTSLVNLRSDKKALYGDAASIKYLVNQLSYNNIKTISFEGFTIDIEMVDSRGQLLYDFYRIAKEIGNSKWISD